MNSLKAALETVQVMIRDNPIRAAIVDVATMKSLGQVVDESLSAVPDEDAKAVAWTIPGADTADVNGFIPTKCTQEGEFTKPLYTAPQPAPSFAEGFEALKSAQQFIRNGVELGYIKMPDADTPDSAHETLPKIESAIASLSPAPSQVRADEPRGVEWMQAEGWNGELPDWIPQNIDLPEMTERGVAGQIMDAAWPCFGGNNMPAEFWYAFGAGAEFTLRARPSATAEAHQLLREALQYVSDAGSDEDGETQHHSAALIADINKALSPQAGSERGGEPDIKLLPCPVCGGEAIHAIETLERTIIKPGPSDTNPSAEGGSVEDTTLGGVTWHSSDEDSGPDVGISVYLGGDHRLWFGEITNQLFEESGKDHFDNDGGRFLIWYKPEPVLIAKCADDLEAREFVEWIASILRTKQGGQPAERREAVARPAGFVKPDTDRQVFFYEQDFYVLSNFSAFRLEWQGRNFDTSEAAYHWEKFVGNDPLRILVKCANSAHEAFKIAEEHKALRRPDWDAVKVDIMRGILRAKADQHEYVRRKLLATNDRELIEDSWRDDFWGWGPNRDGQNMLGKLWMEVRAELRLSALGGR